MKDPLLRRLLELIRRTGSYDTPVGTELVSLWSASGSKLLGYTTVAALQNIGLTAGANLASRAVILDANSDFASFRHLSLTGNIRRSFAAPAAAGANQGAATALTADNNYVTGADDAVGVSLFTPGGVFGERCLVINSVTNKKLKVYPAVGGAIDAIAANGAITLLPGEAMEFVAVSATQWRSNGFNRVASGQQTTVAASDTIVTGLRAVRSVVASYETDVADANFLVTAQIGDQAGAPAAGSIIIKSWQNTTGSDPTPVAAAAFSKKVNWIAVGS